MGGRNLLEDMPACGFPDGIGGSERGCPGFSFVPILHTSETISPTHLQAGNMKMSVFQHRWSAAFGAQIQLPQLPVFGTMTLKVPSVSKVSWRWRQENPEFRASLDYTVETACPWKELPSSRNQEFGCSQPSVPGRQPLTPQ